MGDLSPCNSEEGLPPPLKIDFFQVMLAPVIDGLSTSKNGSCTPGRLSRQPCRTKSNTSASSGHPTTPSTCLTPSIHGISVRPMTARIGAMPYSFLSGSKSFTLSPGADPPIEPAVLTGRPYSRSVRLASIYTPCQANALSYSTFPSIGMLSCDVGVVSVQGLRPSMEDCHTIFTSCRSKASFFGVYDGHGGSQCAEFLRDHLHDLILQHAEFKTNPEKAIYDGIMEADRQFLDRSVAMCEPPSDAGCPYVVSSKLPRISLAGAAGAIAVLNNETLYVANVGDTECMLFRYSPTPHLELPPLHQGEPSSSSSHENVSPPITPKHNSWKMLTEKHSPSCESEKQRILAAGGRVNRTGRVAHPQNRYLSLDVSRSFGDAQFKLRRFAAAGNSGVILEPHIEKVEVGLSKRNTQAGQQSKTRQFTSAELEIDNDSKREFEVFHFDQGEIPELDKGKNDELYLVLACDGLWGSVSPENVSQLLIEDCEKELGLGRLGPTFTQSLAEKLVNAAVSAGSTDNITVIVVRLT